MTSHQLPICKIKYHILCYKTIFLYICYNFKYIDMKKKALLTLLLILCTLSIQAQRSRKVSPFSPDLKELYDLVDSLSTLSKIGRAHV